MPDKLSLSVKNHWVDGENRVYIIYTIEQIMEDISCGNKKAGQLLTELEKNGLIERKRQGLGKPNLIFVKNFIEVSEEHLQKCQNDTSGSVGMTSAEVSKGHGINTNHNKTDSNDTNPILSGCDADGMDERAEYEEYYIEFPCRDDII